MKNKFMYPLLVGFAGLIFLALGYPWSMLGAFFMGILFSNIFKKNNHDHTN